MLTPVPQLGLAKPKLIRHFGCPTFVVIQVIGPNILYLSDTDNSLMATNDNGAIDALQINQASGIVGVWWNGDMWACGSVAFMPMILPMTGVNTGSILGSNSLGLDLQTAPGGLV